MIYYHNPRCSKSREGLRLLENCKKDFKIKLYLSEKITFAELTEIIQKLKIKPIELVRKKEKILKENNIDIAGMSDKQIINILLKFPTLIERPILISDKEAILGRPPENLKAML
jgi:arsenate reductase|tara:strand:- start:353 stop:694 length:342 start_codon:yes stop_codon:yes gene_type:complete